MDKRIAIPAGLAIMVALAVIGVMSIIGLTATNTVEASITNISQGLQGNADLGKLTEPFASPIAAATSVVTGAAASVDPEDPGDLTSLTVNFRTSASTGALANGSGKIIIRFNQDDWADEFPTSISPSSVTIAADSVTGLTGGNGGPNEAVNPQTVTVTREGPESDLMEVTLLVGDMSTDDNTGGNGIDALANVTIVFQQTAGIKNPAEGGNYDLLISTSSDTDPPTDPLSVDTTATFRVPIVIEMNDVKDGRGRNITLIAKGIKGGTATFWLDADADQVQDPGELDLCSGTENNKIATCDFSISNPPFKPGRFDVDVTGATCTGTFTVPGTLDTGVIAGCNYISVIDGEAITQDQRNQTDLDRTIFNLEGSMTASPAEGNPGDTFTVQLKDFPDEPVTLVKMGAVTVCDSLDSPDVVTNCNVSPFSFGTVSNGEHDFAMDVPDGVPEGVQLLVVETTNNDDADTNFIVGGAELLVTPEQVVPNQRVSIIGTGFTDGGGITIHDGSGTKCPSPSLHAATIGGSPISSDNINNGEDVDVDNGGNWSASLDVPVNSSTTTAGPRELKITDCNGRDGTIILDLLERTISLSPEEGRVGSSVTLTGTNFAAKNDDAPDGSPTVTITYDAGNTKNTTTATPDAGGRWVASMNVPTNASIPSTNVVTATYKDNADNDVITTITHRVPRAVISLDKLSGPAGTSVELTATGFKRFTPVKTMEVGNIDVTPAPKPSTGEQGNLTFTFLIPGTDTGVQTVELEVGNTTASVGFTVTDSSGFGDGVLTPIEDALAPLFDDDTLDRAFFFNNVTKEWQFFINDDAFSGANDLDDVASGQPIWIKVTEDKTVDLNNQPFDLTCVNPGTPEEDCWNLVVFP